MKSLPRQTSRDWEIHLNQLTRKKGMATPRQALDVNDTSAAVCVRMALELSDGKWKVAIGDGGRSPSQHCGSGRSGAAARCDREGEEALWFGR
jgi:hypothetical protein